jgi:hypothetical protein
MLIIGRKITRLLVENGQSVYTHYGNKCLTRILNGQNGDELRILIEWSAVKDQFIILKDEDVLSTHYTSLLIYIDEMSLYDGNGCLSTFQWDILLTHHHHKTLSFRQKGPLKNWRKINFQAY